MTLVEVLALRASEPRRFNALVAEHVHGKETFQGSHGFFYLKGEPGLLGNLMPRDYDDNPAADLGCHRVACAWDSKRRQHYFQWLGTLLSNRLYGHADQPAAHWPDVRVLEAYTVGDYATAAIVARLEG